MTTTERTFVASPAAVYAVLVDPGTYPDWLVGAKRIRSVDADWPAPDSTFRHVVGFGPCAIPDTTTSTGTVRDESLSLIVRARPLLEAAVDFHLRPTVDGCVLTMNERPIGIYRLTAPLVEPLVRRRNERSLERLGRVIESRRTTPA